jgi:prepilin-type N-terminal cleavage/methylation domain-containing protein
VGALRPEEGFSLMEVIIVAAIIAAIGAAALWATASSRTASGRVQAVAAARTIGTAVDDFRKDHGGRPPVLGHASDWPAPTLAGPRDNYSDERYMQPKATHGITSSDVAISAVGGATAQRWNLVYRTTARGWSITVVDRDGRTHPCTIAGGQAPAGGAGPC